ncbi:MAG: XRE family transcriptional regulator, partial [Actinobacteria bacterium]|nr:XRE family transcriptional regulator [Actinomycetota bacterium]
NRPMKRMTREQWFETTSGPLKIEPHPSSDRQVHIQRIHDTTNMSKFACQFSPAIEPGDLAEVSYTSRGGRFVHDHYWCQSIPRYTRQFILNIRHRGIAMLLNCTAIEDQIDGSEISAIEDLICSYEDSDALITLTQDYLRPGQAVTVRWKVSHAAS